MTIAGLLFASVVLGVWLCYVASALWAAYYLEPSRYP